MPPKNAVIVNALMTALRKTTSAHNAVKEGIATHAEKHRVALHESREKMARDARIADGAKRANGQL